MKIYINSKYYPFLKGSSKKERTELMKKVFTENKKLKLLFFIYLIASFLISAIIFSLTKIYVSQAYWPILGGLCFGIIFYLSLIYMLSTSIYKASEIIYIRETKLRVDI